MQKCDAERLTTALRIKSIAHALNKIPITIDTIPEFNWEKELLVDMQPYATYQNDIIKKAGTPEIRFWEICTQSIRIIYI